jgi:hypothetical protein
MAVQRIVRAQHDRLPDRRKLLRIRCPQESRIPRGITPTTWKLLPAQSAPTCRERQVQRQNPRAKRVAQDQRMRVFRFRRTARIQLLKTPSQATAPRPEPERDWRSPAST